jgi:hypothetical protein
MTTKKYLKKGKKGHKKNNLMHGGAKIKISGEQIKEIVKKIFDNSVFVGKTVTNVIIANAIFEVLGGVMAGDELTQLSNLGINIIAVSLQFILTSLKLTLGVGSKVGSQLISASSFVTNSLWSAVTSISNICSSNPTATAVVATAATTTVALKNQEIQNIIKNVGNFGLIDSVSIMLFDLLIKSGMFEDSQGYNQLKLEDLKDNQVNDIAEQIVITSRNNTPENTPVSSQDDSQEGVVAIVEDVDMPQYDEEARARLAQLLDATFTAINELSENYEHYEELSDDFLEDADSSKICGKRKNVEENEGNIQKAPRPTDGDNYDADNSSGEDSDNGDIKGGKKTRRRKRRQQKHNTRKHKKTHTKKHKKHIKKHKKHTKKH